MLDVTPHALMVPAALLPSTLRAHQAGSEVAVPLLRSHLEAAGLVVNGRLHPVASDMADVIVDPDLIMQIKVTRTRHEACATVWANERGAVAGRPATESHHELRELRRSALTFHIAEIVRLRARPAPMDGVVLDRRAATDLGLCRLIDDATTAHIQIRAVSRTLPGEVIRHHFQVQDAGALGYWQRKGSEMRGLTTGGALRVIAGCLPTPIAP